MLDVVYICDRKACGDECSYPDCAHTHDIRHAKNFQHLDGDKWIEKDSSPKFEQTSQRGPEFADNPTLALGC